MSSNQNFLLGINSKAVHSGFECDEINRSIAVPIHATSTYQFHDLDDAADLFALLKFGNIYSRITNPTVAALEGKISDLENGVGALVTSSGQSAITIAIANIAGSGDEILSIASLYGGTVSLFKASLARFGVHIQFVNSDDPNNLEPLISEKTKAIYVESLCNPELNVTDIESFAKIANKYGIPLIVDNTAASPVLIQPINWGANIVIHSITKAIGGHSTLIGGAIVDGGNFNWANGKFPWFTEPDAGYNGLVYTEAFGNLAYIIRARVQCLRNFGACLSPFDAFLAFTGCQTIGLRVERANSNALEIASFLENHCHVEWVKYPGLKNNKYYQNAQKYLNGYGGSIVSFGIKGDINDAKKFVQSLKIFKIAVSICDVRSYVTHPASTTHSQLSDAEKKQINLQDNYIRLSIGIEDIKDLLNDISNGFESIS